MSNDPITKRLVGNVTLLTAFQASGYVLAMISVPYLSRVLGVADYGVLAFSISLNAYLWLIVAWGFSLGASREVAQANGDEDRIRQIFWRTFSAKLILSTMSLLVLAATAAIGNVPHTFYVVFLPGAINIISAILSADWMFYGQQRMSRYLLYFIIARLSVVILTFLLVHSPQDTVTACTLQALGAFGGSMANFLLAFRSFKMGKPVIDLRQAARQIWDDRHYFLTQSRGVAYSTAALVVLGLVSGSFAVGLYSGPERIIRTAMSVILPLSTALYPHMNAIIIDSRKQAAQTAGLFLAAQFSFAIVMTILIITCARPIVALILGPHFGSSVIVLRCLASLPLVAGIGSVVSMQFLIPLGRRREVSHVTAAGTLLFLVTLVIFGRYAGALGAAITLVFTEVLVTAGFIVILLRREPDFARISCYAALSAPYRLYRRLSEWR
jgi:polysaccharide transporter, PST family